MMNEKCAACIHCEVCGLIESEVAKDGACDFYEDGKEWELTKEEKALLQKWHDNRGISMKDFEDAMDALEQEPKTGHCKDCKYFEYDSVAKVDGVPLIVAHEICNKWGDGCKTKEDGYCYMYVPQESEGEE